MTVITGTANILMVSFLAQRRALMLEIRTGLKHSRMGSVATVIRRQIPNAARSKAKLLKQHESFMRDFARRHNLPLPDDFPTEYRPR